MEDMFSNEFDFHSETIIDKDHVSHLRKYRVKELIMEAFRGSNKTYIIYYSGHGYDEDGSWVFDSKLDNKNKWNKKDEEFYSNNCLYSIEEMIN
jgi:hypothetical protein